MRVYLFICLFVYLFSLSVPFFLRILYLTPWLMSSTFKVKLVGISNYDIVDGKTTPILGLVWSVILRFQVSNGDQSLERVGLGKGATSLSFKINSELHS